MSAPTDEGREEEPMTERGVARERGLADPVAVGPGGHPDEDTGDGPSAGHADPTPTAGATEAAEADKGDNGAAGDASPAPALAAADASLLALVDRLAAVLERSELGELEVAAGGTTIVLRAPSAVERPAAIAVAPAEVPATALAGEAAGGPAALASAAAAGMAVPAKPSVRAPLTGIFYAAPSPGATPYVEVGDHVAVGQIIGLIEAMKLFNEIKSDLAGRVGRVCVDTGALVKARQPLIEVEPG
jgi:acetyl-CoA carboxylase biotin carboxyl carrier protein